MRKLDYLRDLNAKQKETRNSYHLMAKLADCGFESHRLHNDYQGADIIAVDPTGETLRIQLKGGVMVSKAYIGKGLLIAFPSTTGSEDFIMVDHDALVARWMNGNTSVSWVERGMYSANEPSADLRDWLEKNNMLSE